MIIRDFPVILRTYSTPAAVVPVFYGAVLAAVFDPAPFRAGWFLAALAAMCCLQFSANIINDIKDYERGIDVRVTPSSGGIVRGILTVREAWRLAALFCMTGAGLGLLIAWHAGWLILLYGIIGVACVFVYSVGPFALKYCAMGDLAVFICFGVLGTLGSWTVQTGAFSWRPVLWSLPVALYIVGILHANNWRDLVHDRNCGIKTTAIVMGSRFAALYLYVCIVAPPVLMTLFCLVPRIRPCLSVPAMPWSIVLVWLVCPMLYGMIRRIRNFQRDPSACSIDDLDGSVAKTSLVFGGLALIGLLLG